MGNVEKTKGDVNCKHDFVKQDKETFQILTRVCTVCGRIEHVNDKLSDLQIKNIKGE